MCYASTRVDRRAAYYARCAELIACDPLGFYTRAERGRKYLASRRDQAVVEPSAALANVFAGVTQGAERAVATRESVPEFAYIRGRGSWQD